ncbi:MAG TPA: hypothetical protein VMD08_17935 [Candidatus Baltobacteraceae bacterium]|nr:hypothetical protein [Candidatus Baltobacteraceae bacterium]
MDALGDVHVSYLQNLAGICDSHGGISYLADDLREVAAQLAAVLDGAT